VLGWGGYWDGTPSKCVSDALAYRHGFPALGDDAGKTRHAEDVEHVAGLRHVLAGDSRDFPHAQWLISSVRFRTVFHRRLVSHGSCASLWSSSSFSFSKTNRLSPQRAQARIADLSRIEVSFNNLLFVLLCFTVLLGNVVPKNFGTRARQQSHGRCALLQSVAIPVALLLLFSPLWARCWHAQDVARKPETKLMWPAIGATGVAIFLVITPQSWDQASALGPARYFLLLFADGHCPVRSWSTLTVASEFYRGGRVISKHTGRVCSPRCAVTHRNTRRYGDTSALRRCSSHHRLCRGRFQSGQRDGDGLRRQDEHWAYTLICRSFTDDDRANYSTRVGVARCVQRRQADRYYDSGPPLLQGQSPDFDDARHPLIAE